MSIIFNGTTLDQIIYNNIILDVINYNNIKVFERNIFENYLNMSVISENDFLNNVLIDKCFSTNNPSTNLPWANDFVGHDVEIVNSKNNIDSTYKTNKFKIIGYNHDNTTNTFDLLSWDYVAQGPFSYGTASGGYRGNQNYRYSAVREYLTTEANYINGFSNNIKNKLQTMTIKYNANEAQMNEGTYPQYSAESQTGTIDTLSDKIKILSCPEIGYSSLDRLNNNNLSNKYQYFSDNKQSGTSYTEFNFFTSANKGILLRTRYSSCMYIQYITPSHAISFHDLWLTMGYLPVIRLKV